jgi:Domain of unknown function (DUF4342)
MIRFTQDGGAGGHPISTPSPLLLQLEHPLERRDAPEGAAEHAQELRASLGRRMRSLGATRVAEMARPMQPQRGASSEGRPIMAESRMPQEKPVTDEARKESAGGKVTREELKVAGENLLKTIREVIHEGNYRRIIIRNDHGHTLLEIPLTIGLVGAMLMPVWVAIGAMAAMATGFTIIVERPADGSGDKKVTPS